MKRLLLICALILPVSAIAEEPWEMGERLCREEGGENLMARQKCLMDWQKSAQYVFEYYVHAGLMDRDGNMVEWTSLLTNFDNPFVLSPKRVINKCSKSQIFNGNLFSGDVDFRDFWDCISDTDPQAAAWDSI